MHNPDTHARQILAARGLRLSPCHATRAQGFLNTVYFAQDDAGARFVLRIARDDNRADIEDYIGRQLRLSGAAAYGARLCYRDMPTQVALMRDLAARGVRVPDIVDSGKDWMLMRFVAGRSLKDIFTDAQSANADAALRAVLNACVDVHRHCIALWDRWGGNELVDVACAVCFIDFEIAVEFPPQVSSKTAAALDLAFFLRGCVQYAHDAKHAAGVLADVIATRDDFAEVYDMPALSSFLEGQLRFYEAEYCGNPAVDAHLREKHRHDNDHMTWLAKQLHGVHKR